MMSSRVHVELDHLRFSSRGVAAYRAGTCPVHLVGGFLRGHKSGPDRDEYQDRTCGPTRIGGSKAASFLYMLTDKKTFLLLLRQVPANFATASVAVTNARRGRFRFAWGCNQATT